MTIPIDLAAIKAKAEAATPGSWKWVTPDKGYTMDYILTDHPDYTPTEQDRFRNYVAETECRFPAIGSANAAYIAAMDPPTAIAMIARIEAAEAERDNHKRQADQLDIYSSAQFDQIGDLQRRISAAISERDRLAGQVKAMKEALEKISTSVNPKPFRSYTETDYMAGTARLALIDLQSKDWPHDL